AALANDTGTAGDGITRDGTVNVGGLEEDAGWQYSLDGGQTWQPGTGTSFALPEGDYAEGQVQVRQTDAAGNPGTPALLGPVTVYQLSPIDDVAGVDLTITPTISQPDLQTGRVGGLLNVGLLGDTVDATVLAANSALTFQVEENTTRQVSIDGSGFATLNLSLFGDVDFDIQVYRAEAGRNVATLVYEQANWLVGTGVLAATWDANVLTLPEFQGGGTYYIVLGNDGGLLDLSLLGGLSVSTVSDEISDYRTVSGSVGGNVLDDDTAPAGTEVSSVNGTAVEGLATEIPGRYGTLTIDPDGTYTYTAKSPFIGSDGAQDVFEYTITTPDGVSESATLTVTLGYDSPLDASVTPVEGEMTGAMLLSTGADDDLVPLGDFQRYDDEAGDTVGSEAQPFDDAPLTLEDLVSESGEEVIQLDSDAGDFAAADVSGLPETVEDPFSYLPSGLSDRQEDWVSQPLI
ncbi:Ig-like domain-containing protein, partial [Chelativorans sp. J32]|uniref:Ig-like domain-containing protein n=1 Tax=Chelativorans sp. J32 TaxID=935840 RepID=UPI00054E2B6F